ncbi:MAG: glycosyltransferase family 2 protein [Phycisphaerales bacterium JB039]
MPEPLLSIITPSLNQAAYLRECLRSVQGQGLRMAGPGEDGELEHIVVDGGSTDGSAQIIRAAPELAWSVSEPDRGQSDAINKGMAHARGAWAGWLNADDWYEPRALAAVRRALEADPSVDVLVGRCRFVDLEGRTVFSPRPPEPITLANLLRLRSQWFNGRLIVQPEAFFRTSLFRDLGGLNLENHYTMDHELWLRMLRAGARFATLDAPVACLRVHPAQKTSDNRRIVRCMLEFARPIFEDARAAGALGGEADPVGAELDAVAGKLAAADLVRARWEAARDAPRPLLGGVGARWQWREAPVEALELSRPHARAAARRLRGGRCCALDPSGGAALRIVMPELLATRTLRRRFETSIITGAESLQGEEQFDLVCSVAALVHADDPAGLLRRLWERLRPGGSMLLLAETAVVDQLPEYLAELGRLMDCQLSQNHDVLISEEAAPWIRRVQRESADSEAAGAWAAAHPSGFGADLDAIAGELGARIVLRRRYGGLWYHPLAPFPEPERPGARRADCWATELWEKPAATGG